MTKKSRQKFKYLENENSFYNEIQKAFKGRSLKQIKHILEDFFKFIYSQRKNELDI